MLKRTCINFFCPDVRLGKWRYNYSRIEKEDEWKDLFQPLVPHIEISVQDPLKEEGEVCQGWTNRSLQAYIYCEPGDEENARRVLREALAGLVGELTSALINLGVLIGERSE